MDVRSYNREAWNREVEGENPWTIPVSAEVIAAAKNGEWNVLLTPTHPVPRSWFPSLIGNDILCLASGGGQQGSIFCAAGGHVTVFDNSPKQLAQDRMVADREGFIMRTIEGDMRDLSVFPDSSFDIVFHPISNLFVPDIRPMWRETFRVLRQGWILLAGFVNPIQYIFDLDIMEDEGILDVKYSIPYSDLSSLNPEKRSKYFERGWPVEFGHSMEDQIGGQLDAGFNLTGFYEDADPTLKLSKYIPIYIATRAVKPAY